MQELREKADAYRKRACGTHFSQQHLNQILSDHNWMWEPSSGTSSSSSIESEACRNSSSTPIIEALDLARWAELDHQNLSNLVSKSRKNFLLTMTWCLWHVSLGLAVSGEALALGLLLLWQPAGEALLERLVFMKTPPSLCRGSWLGMKKRDLEIETSQRFHRRS